MITAAKNDNDWLNPGESFDDLTRDGLKVIQSKDGYRFALDSVLLSHFLSVHPREKVVDLGCGCGVMSLLLASREPTLFITGIDIQQDMADRARRSVSYNRMEHRIAIRCQDLKDTEQFDGAHYDAVISNPPYEPLGHGRISHSREIALARHELACNMEDLFKTAANVLRPQGRIAVVYPARRLAEAMRIAAGQQLEPKRLQLIYPAEDKEANLFLLEAVRQGKPGLKVLKPLIVYSSPQQYSRDIMDIYFN